jgi:transposase
MEDKAMKYFAGLDVSMIETSVCIVDQDGAVIREGRAATDPAAINTYLKATGFAFERVGFETGPCSAWLYKGLIAAGLPAICMDARHASAALKAQNVKTDRNDARGLAQIVRTGWYRLSHVKSEESQRRRVLLNTRKSLLEQRVELENRIRGNLKVFGLKIGQVTPLRYEGRVRELVGQDAELLGYIEPLLKVRACILAEFRELDQKARALAAEDAVCRLFMSIPGVGPLTALAYKAAIDDPRRFAKSANVGAHLGLTPRKYASGEIDYSGRITKCGDPLARNHLFEAAAVLMRRSMKKSALKDWGTRIARRGSMKRAYVAVARKLSVIMHRMWLDGTAFDFGAEATAIAA